MYCINGWAGDGGDKLHDEEDGCGILSGWDFHAGEKSELQRRQRDTQSAVFGLLFFKGGCVERAVHSAGGPEPGDGPGQLSCEHYHGGDTMLLSIKKNLKSAQLKGVSDVADSQKAQGLQGSNKQLAVTGIKWR